MLRLHLIMLTAAALLVTAACTSPRPVETSDERPSAAKVARSASDATAEADADDLVLYSSSMEEAELEAGAEDDTDLSDDGARAGEGVEDEALPEQVELAVSADSTFTLDGETFSEVPALIAALEARRTQRPSETMLIRAGADVSHQAVVDALTAARRAGYTEFELQVADEEPSENPTDAEPEAQ
jgi:biopolymer transport protein ExbD